MIEHSVKTIDVHELKKRMDDDKHLCLVDVRELNEWQTSHIPGALHIPKAEVAAKIQAQIEDKTQAIYLHCQGGIRSLYAAQQLSQLGYEEVYSINGGIMDWVKSGYVISNS